MEHTAETSDIILNVVIQIINLAIFFWVFVKFFGAKIVVALQEREENLKKLQDADAVYNQKLEEIEQHRREVLADVQVQKQHVLDYAQQLAQQKEKELVDAAQSKANNIVSTAEEKSATMQRELAQEFESSVKQGIKTVIKKLFQRDPALQQAYIDEMVGQLSKK